MPKIKACTCYVKMLFIAMFHVLEFLSNAKFYSYFNHTSSDYEEANLTNALYSLFILNSWT